jgi:hypothetical protein
MLGARVESRFEKRETERERRENREGMYISGKVEISLVQKPEDMRLEIFNSIL